MDQTNREFEESPQPTSEGAQPEAQPLPGAPTGFTQLRTTMIGREAMRVMTGNPTVTTAGVTSRGVFLRLDAGSVVFLSTEAFHGPLTLNLSGDPAPLLRLTPGEPALITGEGVVFPAHDLEVLTGEALRWQASALPGRRLSAGRVRARLRDTIEQATAAEPDLNLAPGLLLELRRLMARTPISGDAGGPFLALMKRLSRALHENQPLAVGAALQECLGRGPGLTPSGDDLVLGLLLALGRWGADLGVSVPIDAFGPELTTAAERQTTLLAANLIACAADGQADERLVTALDGIVVGELDPADCSAYLRSWGSSSGIDALAGMACVLLAAPDNP